MTNTKLLREKIEASGLKLAYIASQLWDLAQSTDHEDRKPDPVQSCRDQTTQRDPRN